MERESDEGVDNSKQDNELEERAKQQNNNHKDNNSNSSIGSNNNNNNYRQQKACQTARSLIKPIVSNAASQVKIPLTSNKSLSSQVMEYYHK